MKKTGWIGTGQMGLIMAGNLLKGGYEMSVYNRTPEKAKPLADAGAHLAGSAREVVESSDTVFLMLSNGEAVRQVLTAEDGILASVAPGQVIIDMSTISPEESREFAELATAREAVYIDAPVSGSVGVAAAAQLIILAGASEEQCKQYQHYFDLLGKKTISFGGAGCGSSAKLAINLLLGITGQAIGETLLLAERAGLSQEKVFEMISLSGMNTPLFQAKKEMLSKEEYAPAFMLGLMSKDLGLITAEASRMNLSLPLAEKSNATYRRAVEKGRGDLDMAAIYLELQEMNTL